MNTTHRFFLFLQIISLILISCQREDERPGSLSGQKEFVLHASQEADYSLGGQYDTDTKSVLQTDGKVFWSPGDSISFFIGKGSKGGYPLVSNNSAVSSEADFIGTIANCSDNSTFYAIYPYSPEAACDGSTLTTVLPAEQTAVEGSFADDLFISVAASKNDRMKFYHVCGGFKFSVVGEGINRVVFKNADGGSLAGKLTVKFDDSGLPVVTGISGGSDAITVNAPAGGTFTPGKYYYAVLPPTKFTQGMKITYYRDSENCIFRTAKEFEVKRAIFGRVYDKDEGLKYRKTVNSYGRFNRNQILPSGVNRETITEMHFYTDTTEVTDIKMSSGNGKDEYPIYFKLDGTVASYYTEADCFTANYYNSLFADFAALKTIDFSNWNTQGADSMSYMFFGCESLQYLDLSSLDTYHVRSMAYMFYKCSSLEYMDISNFDTFNVVSFNCMFALCKKLSSLDVSSFDTSNATDMSKMFFYCLNVGSLDVSHFVTSKVTDFSGMFLYCSGLSSLDVSSFDTSVATDMSDMFSVCSNLTSLDLSNFNTSNVCDFSYMFIYCDGLRFLDVSGFNTSSATNMSDMFRGCNSLTSIDVSNFDTSNVTDMNYMFAECCNLISLDFSNFNTSNVTGLCAFLGKCQSLTSIDLSNFDTSNVTDMSLFLADDYNLQSVDLSSFNTEKVENMSAMFQNCKSLQILNLSNFSTPTLKTVDWLFTFCTSLKRLDISHFDLSSVTSLHAACNCIGENSKSCKIICSSATKKVLENEDTYLSWTEDKIRWYLDGEMPGSDDDDDEELYASTDYSMDGKYTVLQKASVGEGVDIVFIGDAYSDRLIADGTYENRMKSAMEQFFAEEPYKSLRNMFNVYEVFAVSQNETTDGITALNTYFGDGTTVGGNDSKAMSYACGVNSIDNLDNVLINVIVNQKKYAGTAYMYYPSSGDYGAGLSITYTPLGRTEEEFGNTLRHEAGGHGFAKLADEYFYDYRGEIPQSEKEEITNNLAPYGWYKNIDFTDNLSDIKWSRFVSDTRYSSQNIGAYLGGATYPYGVWRPTENSIMRYNTDGFNAPSREAIYYRINKLAYGESWEYDYETFVDFDRNTFGHSSAAKVQRAPYVRDFQPTAPPVVVQENWRTLLKKYENRLNKKPVEPLKFVIEKEIIPTSFDK